MGVINLGALVEKLKKKMTGTFVKTTDYPSGNDAGVIKVDTTYATDVTSGGKLKAKEITAEAYSEANDAAFISKKTLDNVLAAQPSAGLTETVLFTGSTTIQNETAIPLTGQIDGNTLLCVVMSDNEYSLNFSAVYPVSMITKGTTKMTGSMNSGTQRYVAFQITAGTGIDNFYPVGITGNCKLIKVSVFK